MHRSEEQLDPVNANVKADVNVDGAGVNVEYNVC